MMRYYLIKICRSNATVNFYGRDIREANNNELVNNLANFFNRVVVLINKYYGALYQHLIRIKDL